MPSVRNLLSSGNGKLGEGIHAWSLLAIESCPGRSDLCARVCYARSGRFQTRAMQARLTENLTAAQAHDFAHRITAEVHRRGVHTLRIHVGGDFFDADYVDAWAAVARRCPRTTFYAYTRSWRLPPIAQALDALSGLPNVRLWYSCDAETGPPADIPSGVRVAYLQTERDEQPTGDLVFRVRPLRGLPVARSSLPPVCPTEVAVPRTPNLTCTSCRICHHLSATPHNGPPDMVDEEARVVSQQTIVAQASTGRCSLRDTSSSRSASGPRAKHSGSRFGRTSRITRVDSARRPIRLQRCPVGSPWDFSA